MAGDTATWEQLLGSEDWNGILDPMFLSLRKLILRCGDFAEATYDAFDNDPNSDNRGNSLYSKETLFESVKVKNRADYKIVSFLYATSGIKSVDSMVLNHPSERSLNPWDRVSNWIGYVAITTDTASNSRDRREIYVVWRGTTTDTEWSSNVDLEPVSIEPLLSPRTDRSLWNWSQDGEPKVHKGWLDIYTSTNSSSNYVKKSARGQLWDVIDGLKEKYKREKLSIVATGHSLGGSLATLSAFDLVANGFRDIRVSVFAFSCPKVGNEAFKKTVEKHSNFKILHTHIRADVVPNLPGPRYVPVRTAELEVQAVKSGYLKLISRPIYVHNLEVVLHMVAGWNGANKAFQLDEDVRELVLVNKWTGFLIDSLKVPESWWPTRNNPGSKLKYDDKTQKWVLV